jgi:hypothetical protein
MNVHFTVIDELDEGMKIRKCNILKDNYWMLAWGTLEIKKIVSFEFS